MWAFTGGCHYDNFCNRYVEKCGSCPLLTSKRWDITSLAIALKQNAYETARIAFVSPSSALTSAAKKSYLLKNQKIVTIPHGLDFSRYRIIDKKIAREQLGIPKDRIYLLFGCTGGVNDERKGFKYIGDALVKIRNLLPQNTTVLMFGTSNNPFEKTNLNFPTISIGKLHDDASLSLLYSAANVTLMPSKQEALGLMSMESMACGTPVVGFDETGLADIIEHQLTGYLSKPNDAEDFSKGILWTLENVKDEKRGYLRDGMINKFEIRRVAEMYERLYTQLLHKTI
jgi:glycosyltransferase involved in cell wall biosynthesis